MTSPTRILLIDDDAVDRASVRRALRNSEIAHELVEAPDGATGLRLAKAQTFDCVLLDYRLPDVEAADLLAALLSPEGGAQAVLMLTGEADQDVALRLMRAGALDYIAKGEATPSSLARAIRYAKARRAFLTELERARHEAEEKSRALDTLNRQKTFLFSIIAHDLRNPFQALLGLSTILGNAVAAKDLNLIERRAQGIHDAAGQACALMESLLAWVSLQMDTVDVAFSDVGLEELARDTVESMGELGTEKKGLLLTIQCDGFRVKAHRDMLAAVLRNLVSNAVKFTSPGGAITISARRRGEDVEVAVTDTGVGIPPNKIVNLFDLNRRTTTTGTAGERGSGLGLLLCRELVERQGGELTVQSVLDVGTTFSFTLPSAGQPEESSAIS